jgi:ribosome-binding factor A
VTTSGGRRERLEAAMRAELAPLLGEVRDPRVGQAGLMTLTRVALTRDLSIARVGVSFVGGEGDPEAALKALSRAAGFLRGEVGRRMGLRHAPELRFVHDRGSEYAAQIDALLREDGGE